MPSPFSGMNPYFEQPDLWHDVHTEFVTRLRRQFAPQIAPGYFVQIEEHLHRDQEIERVPFLEVRDRRELVAVIELLSPSNKRPSENREQYLAKRRELLHSYVHLVEIDLLRGWPPMPMEDRPECDYSVLVSRAERRLTAGFWPIRLRERLPIIPVPLRPPDGDVPVDLQDVLHRPYDGPGYEHFIYRGLPDPPLTADDAAWARTFVP